MAAPLRRSSRQAPPASPEGAPADRASATGSPGSPSAAIEAVDWHLAATLPADPAALDLGWRAPAGSRAGAGRREAWFPETEGFVDTAIHDRRLLVAGTRIDGPAIVEQLDSTTVVHPGQRAEVDALGNLLIHVGGS